MARTKRPAGAGEAGAGSNRTAGQTFQQVGVNQSSETALFSGEGIITTEMNDELSQSANQAFVVQGSMSSALGFEGQNDWGGFGRGGPGGMGGPDMMGMGGRGMGRIGGMPGMGADGEIAAGGEQIAGMDAAVAADVAAPVAVLA